MTRFIATAILFATLFSGLRLIPMFGGFIDPNGRPSATATSDEGAGFDPFGRH